MSVDSRSEAPDYIGRFAPSPTGALHFGSLVTALASFLDARAHGGMWLLRLEDLDPPREEPGASDLILEALRAHGLAWDGEVTWQSKRHPLYQKVLEDLDQSQQTYACACSRQRLQSLAGRYDGHCLHTKPKPGQPVAIKLKVGQATIDYIDRVQGPQTEPLTSPADDFVLRRKDHLFAYQLAVVVDDFKQGVTHVVRGSDLLDSTAKQIRLQQLLGYPTPRYAHLPVVLGDCGQKLSKQNLAEPLDLGRARDNLLRALGFLGQSPCGSLSRASVAEVLDWAVGYWFMDRVPKHLGLEAQV